MDRSLIILLTFIKSILKSSQQYNFNLLTIFFFTLIKYMAFKLLFKFKNKTNPWNKHLNTYYIVAPSMPKFHFRNVIIHWQEGNIRTTTQRYHSHKSRRTIHPLPTLASLEITKWILLYSFYKAWIGWYLFSAVDPYKGTGSYYRTTILI